MMDVSKIEGFQIVDEKLNLIYPWYTKSFLEWLITQDLSDKYIFEYGVGYSTIWFANHCKFITGVDNNKQWSKDVIEYATKLDLLGKMVIYNEEEEIDYLNCINKCKETPDIIVIDGIYRDECIPIAIEKIKNGGIIICDNWMQPSVHMCKTPELLEKFEHKIFKHEGHQDWQTAYFIINK